MSNKDKYFRGQQENELYVAFFRHHWITLLREFLYFLMFLVALALVIVNFPRITELTRGDGQVQVLFIFGFLALTIYFHRFFMRIFNYFTDVGIITNVRIIDHDKTLFARDLLDSVDMAQIQNMEMVRNGVLANLLGYGEIKLFLNASSVVKTFDHIPNLKFYSRTLNACMEERKSRFAAIARPLTLEDVAPEGK